MIDNVKRLSERFPTEAHAQRKQGSRMLTYLGIEHVIGRLNEVFGDSYSTEIISSQLQGDWAIVSVRLTYTDASGATRWKDGIGADMWTYVDSYGKTQVDMDKALKTAYAEGIKKAGHQLGVGLYLWDDDIRKEVEQEMRNPAAQPKHEQRSAAAPPRADANSQPPADKNGNVHGLSQAQIKRIFGISKQHGVTNETVRSLMFNHFGIDSTNDLNRSQYDRLCDVLIPQFQASLATDGAGPELETDPTKYPF